MEQLAPPDMDGPPRLTEDQAEELVLRTVATQAEALLRTAYRHSLCDDDAHDAYQRGLEIFVRRAPQLDPTTADRWLHVVVKREAWAVREARSDVLALPGFDADREEAIHFPSPEEQTIDAERVTAAAEALQRLKPQELRVLWLKAGGSSYLQISEQTGYSRTKINRCLAEGRKRFLERVAGIEAGTECARWEPVLSAIVDGEASAEQMADARPHLRNCGACRATLRELHDADRSFAAVLPLGLAGLGAKVGGFFERLASLGGGDAPAATGGAALFGTAGAKVVGVLAAGAVATAGGVAAHEHRAAHRDPAHVAAKAVSRAVVSAPAVRRTVARDVAAVPGAAGTGRTTGHASAHRVTARRSVTKPGRVEFAPVGAEPTSVPTPPAQTVAISRQNHANAAAPVASPAPAPSSTDSSAGEFAPHP